MVEGRGEGGGGRKKERKEMREEKRLKTTISINENRVQIKKFLYKEKIGHNSKIEEKIITIFYN